MNKIKINDDGYLVRISDEQELFCPINRGWFNCRDVCVWFEKQETAYVPDKFRGRKMGEAKDCIAFYCRDDLLGIQEKENG